MQSKKSDFPLLQRILISGIATCCAVTFTNPIETVKTRIQLQGELSKFHQKFYKNIFNGIRLVYKNEGIRGLQKGLLSAYGYQFFNNGVRLGTYSFLQQRFFKSHPSDKYFFQKNLACGAISGIVGAIFGSPFDLIKTRFQSSSKAIPQVGYQHNYRSIREGLRNIIHTDGIAGFLRGAQAAAARIAVASSVQLSMYDQCKKWLCQASPSLFKDNIYTHIPASLFCGMFVVMVVSPFDVVSTRLYNQKVVSKKGKLYNGIFDCFWKILRIEGIKGFYKGVGALYTRVAPHTILVFVFWEQAKKLANKWFIQY